jgi:hypothetical protein
MLPYTAAAKYGFEACHLAPAQELFEKEVAGLATYHDDARLRAARALQFLPEGQLGGLDGSLMTLRRL